MIAAAAAERGATEYYMGQFIVDDGPLPDPSGKGRTVMRMTVPAKNEEDGGRDKIDSLDDEIIKHLHQRPYGKFESQNQWISHSGPMASRSPGRTWLPHWSVWHGAD